LRHLGISEADLPDADRALCELRSDCCACHCRKRRFQSFCNACIGVLKSPAYVWQDAVVVDVYSKDAEWGAFLKVEIQKIEEYKREATLRDSKTPGGAA
jgi:hypothetical protein